MLQVRNKPKKLVPKFVCSLETRVYSLFIEYFDNIKVPTGTEIHLGLGV